MRTPLLLFKTISVAVAAASLCPRGALAWSINGHKAVALIAQSRLSDAARAKVREILGPTATLESIAPCADDIRGRTDFDCSGLTLQAEPESQSWHFIDVPIADSPADGDALEAYCPAGGCVVDQIRAQVESLRSGVTAQREDANASQLALMFLVHLVGDLHQPLHCAHEIVDGVSDRGGNLKSVNYEGKDLALHALWDHQIQSSDVNDPEETSARLIADLQGKDVSAWLQGDFVAGAALESFAIAKSEIYPAYYDDAQGGRTLGPEYRARMAPIVDERLERAGVRLAALIEAALAPPDAGPEP